MRERGNKMTARNRKTAVEGNKEKGEERERDKPALFITRLKPTSEEQAEIW